MYHDQYVKIFLFTKSWRQKKAKNVADGREAPVRYINVFQDSSGQSMAVKRKSADMKCRSNLLPLGKIKVAHGTIRKVLAMHIHVNLWICNFKPKEGGVWDNQNIHMIDHIKFKIWVYMQNVSSISGVSDKPKNVRVYQSLT